MQGAGNRCNFGFTSFSMIFIKKPRCSSGAAKVIIFRKYWLSGWGNAL
jgi:hypothetical protein